MKTLEGIPEKERLLLLNKLNLPLNCKYGIVNWYVINEDDEIVESFSSETTAKMHCAWLKRLIGINCYYVISKEKYEKLVTTKKRKK